MEYINPEVTKQEQDVLDAIFERCNSIKVKPLALVLHGSRVNGSSYEYSDWDVYVVTTKVSGPPRPEFMLGELFIDIQYIPNSPSVDTKEYLETVGIVPAQKFKLLWAKDSKSKELVDKFIEASYNRYQNITRGTWSKVKAHWLETYFRRNIYKITNCKDPLRRAVYISTFITTITKSQYYHFKNQYNHSISEGSSIIKKNDPELYRLLVKLPKLSSKRALEKNLRAIYDYFRMLADEHPGTKG